MAYQVFLKPSAEKSLDDLPRHAQRRIIAKLELLKSDARPSGSIKLAGTVSAYRLRIGEWRLVYEVDESSKTVLVTIIAHRRESYRGI